VAEDGADLFVFLLRLDRVAVSFLLPYLLYLFYANVMQWFAFTMRQAL
jgi:hypothetical protein